MKPIYHLIFLPKSMVLIFQAWLLFNRREFRTLILAIRLHGFQTRKYTNTPYWWHLLEVATMVRSTSYNSMATQAALLHDVIEDTPTDHMELSIELQMRLPRKVADYIADLVVELTDIYTASLYPDLNRRMRKNLEVKRLSQTTHVARIIKFADIISNTRSIKKHDPNFYRLYRLEALNLIEYLQPGVPQELISKALMGVIDPLPEQTRKVKVVSFD